MSEDALGDAIANLRLSDGSSLASWTPGHFAPQFVIGLTTFTGGTSIIKVEERSLKNLDDFRRK